jgi:DNA-binding CsgD family transcriptional regulator
MDKAVQPIIQQSPALDLGSDDWLDSLTALSRSAGGLAFAQNLFCLLNRVLAVDHCAVFTFDPAEGAGHLFTTSRMGDETARELADDYVGGYFARDPNFLKIQAVAGTEAAHSGGTMRMDMAGAYDPTYRQHFFERTELIDKASTIAGAETGSVYCNFYRMQGSGLYSQAEWLMLNRMLPLLTSLIATHYRLLRASSASDRKALSGSPHSLVHSVIGMAVPPFDRLTVRERDVCARILLGYSSEAIGLDLGIAASSVTTYRRRAYARLGIVSQNELFSCCLAAIGAPSG